MSDNERASQNSDNRGCFGKFIGILIGLLTAVGGGAGIVALLEHFEDNDPPPVVQPPNPDPTPPIIVNDGSSASAYCSSQFRKPQDYQDCLQAARNCDPSELTYEVCILGEMGRIIIENP